MTEEKFDLSILDRLEILQFIFFPRRDFSVEPLTANAKNYYISVEEGVSIGCRFYICEKDSPNVLFFHGNGEIVSDYDEVAPMYNRIGANLFVADYRGYGFSGGTPTLTRMIGDAHKIFKAFIEILKENNYTGKLFLMGRSLGSASTIELAYHYQNQVDGLIIESGFADIFKLLEYLGFPLKSLNLPEGAEASHLSKIHSISIPLLVIHAEYDHIVPLKAGEAIFENVSTDKKGMLVISNADHNTIMIMGMEKYFRAIEEFLLKS
ncbi:MAG: alpha/beta fold hydrolase [Pseudomonadota bacterium]